MLLEISHDLSVTMNYKMSSREQGRNQPSFEVVTVTIRPDFMCQRFHSSLMSYCFSAVTSHRAYVHQYTKYGIEEEDFLDSFTALEQVISSYTILWFLKRSLPERIQHWNTFHQLPKVYKLLDCNYFSVLWALCDCVRIVRTE